MPADLSIVKTALASSGGGLTFTLRVSNAGPGSASGVAVMDALADRVSFLSAATTKGSCSYASATRTVSCSNGSMAVGETVTVTIHAIAGGKGQIDNTGTVSAGVPDPNTGNNSSSVHLKLK